MTSRRSLVLCLTSVLGLLAALGPAQAQVSPQTLVTEPTVHGTICRPRRSDQAKVDYAADRGIFNDSTAAAKVYCPMTTFEYQSSNQNRAVIVVVVDNNPSSDVSCNLVLQDALGRVVYTSPTQKTSGASSTPKELDFFSGNSAIVTTVHVALHVNCTLPAKSSTGLTSQIRQLRWFGPTTDVR